MNLQVRVRDRYLIRIATQRLYTDHSKVAASLPHPSVITAIIEATWESRTASSKEAFGAVTRAVTKLFRLFQSAPHALSRLTEALAIDGWSEMSWPQRAKALGSKLKEVLTEGKRVLGKVFQKISRTFPISLFFVPSNKMPGLTDLMNRLVQRVPWLKAALAKVHAGAVKVDQLFTKYLPKLRRPIYAAIFIWVWMNVSELSWDAKGILAGFIGQISLSELLASLPESGIGFIAASFGLGYGALPYVMVARIMWLVAQNYLSYVPEKGLQVHWDKLGLPRPRELVPL